MRAAGRCRGSLSDADAAEGAATALSAAAAHQRLSPHAGDARRVQRTWRRAGRVGRQLEVGGGASGVGASAHRLVACVGRCRRCSRGVPRATMRAQPHAVAVGGPSHTPVPCCEPLAVSPIVPSATRKHCTRASSSRPHTHTRFPRPLPRLTLPTCLQYDQSVSTYSPDGKLYQVEYSFKVRLPVLLLLLSRGDVNRRRRECPPPTPSRTPSTHPRRRAPAPPTHPGRRSRAAGPPSACAARTASSSASRRSSLPPC